MRYTALALAVLATTGQAAECPPDLDDTVSTTLNVGLPSYTTCADCRLIYKYDGTGFPQDWNNHVWNYIRTTASTSYKKYFGNLDGSSSASTMMVRTVNKLGQSANTAVVTTFEITWENDDPWCPTPELRRKRIQEIKLITVLPTGEAFTQNYSYATFGMALYPIPAGPGDDFATPGKQCYSNDGYKRSWPW